VTTPTPVHSAPVATPVTVTVAVLDATAPPSAALRAALDASPERGVVWRVLSDEAATSTAVVDIVVCGDSRAAAATCRWPAAVVVALVPPPPPDGGPGLPAAVLYLPSGDVGLVAAYVRSIARRRRPTAEEPGR
jgi:hypothetical protein